MTPLAGFMVAFLITTLLFLGWTLFLAGRLQYVKAELARQRYAKDTYQLACDTRLKDRNTWMDRHEKLVQLLGEIALVGGWEAPHECTAECRDHDCPLDWVEPRIMQTEDREVF